MLTSISELAHAARRAWAPPPKLSLSEWADAHAHLSAESSAEAGRWHTLPYQKGIMDAITDPDLEYITVMKSARVGYTKIINHTVGYHIHQDPCPIMVVQPTIEDAKGYSKEEIAPMLEDTSVLKGLVKEARSRDSNNTVAQKRFPGGSLSLVGANSPRGFRRVSRRIVLFDEVDGYPVSAGTEGDPIKLGIKRTEYYWNRKIVSGSTPTKKDSSRIERMFNESDQRRFFVPCPHCGEMQYLKWGGRDSKYGIKWPDGEPEKAYYVCEHNGCIIDHKEKRRMIERGEWRATAPGKPRHAGFHIWAAYSFSPNATWGHLASEFLEAKDKPLELMTFVNTALGETWEEEYTAKLGAEALEERADDYSLLSVPEGGLMLTAGVDVQDNRIAILIRAWGVDEESWLVNYVEIFGDPVQLANKNSEIRQQVDSVLQQEYEHDSGIKMQVRAGAVDTGGHHTHTVYAWIRSIKAKRHIIAIKGSSQGDKPAIGKPTYQDINFRNQTIKRGVKLFLVGTNTIKNAIYSRMRSDLTEGPGVYHWPLGLSNEYYKQLTTEKQRTKYTADGTAKKLWVKKPGARNEAWDCEVYAYAALQYFYSRVNRATIWQQLQEVITKYTANSSNIPANINENPEPVKTVKRKIVKRRTGFTKGWKH